MDADSRQQAQFIGQQGMGFLALTARTICLNHTSATLPVPGFSDRALESVQPTLTRGPALPVAL